MFLVSAFTLIPRDIWTIRSDDPVLANPVLANPVPATPCRAATATAALRRTS